MSVNLRKDEIFNIAKEIAIEEGLSKLTIRTLAKKSNISVGSIYNIFGTKDQLILELIESYWENSLRNIIEESKEAKGDFIYKLNSLYISFKTASEEFHKDWIKDLINVHMANPDIVNMSNKYKELIEIRIRELINEDENINRNFNIEEFSDFIFENIMIQLRKNSKDIGFLEKILIKALK